jgi:hypothetical protein
MHARLHLIGRGIKRQAQQLRPEEECGWVMAHQNAPAQEGNRLVIHDEPGIGDAVDSVDKCLVKDLGRADYENVNLQVEKALGIRVKDFLFHRRG